jgi:antitoxin component of MazEF toxin-antitoxin module
MTRKLVKTGNSSALIVDKTMKEHLDISDEIEVFYEKGRIILRKPLTVREASARSGEKFRKAYKRLAE